MNKDIKEKLNERRELYFGSPDGNITEIFSGKFLTCYKSIACCFAIDLKDTFGDLNKRYTSINWGFDQWSKSENYLERQVIPKKINIINNAKEWIKTSGVSIGYLYCVDVDEYLLNHLETFGDSDPRWEVVYKGKKKISVRRIDTVELKWTCNYSPIKSEKCGFAVVGAEKYEPPYDTKTLKELYPKLLKDPVHRWRARTGIELIHKEPDFQEQCRIWYNWNMMTDEMKEISDKKSKSLFGMTNVEHHNAIMEYEWNSENYFNLNENRLIYDKRDMELNGLKYIHISTSDVSITFKPRIPKNVMEFKGEFKMYEEDTTIPRICCSESLFGAIAAINVKPYRTYYVHLLEPKNVMNNIEVARFVPDAVATGECWILDDEIKSKVVGKVELGQIMPYISTFLKTKDNFRCVAYRDYTFIPFESKFERTYRKIISVK